MINWPIASTSVSAISASTAAGEGPPVHLPVQRSDWAWIRRLRGSRAADPVRSWTGLRTMIFTLTDSTSWLNAPTSRSELWPSVVGLLVSLVSLTPMAAAQSPSVPATVEPYIRAELRRQRIPGLSVAILRRDQPVLVRGYGYANLEHRVRATDTTVYEVGSVTKQFTAAALVMLSEQGQLRLDDPITRYLPEGSTAWKGVTIKHLLTHTSGIPEYPDTALDYRRDYSDSQLVRLAAAQALQFAPGESESYSSTGYV